VTTTRAHYYATIVAGSTFAPLTIELRDRRTGLALDLTGAEVKITIIDETTGETIAAGATATPNTTNPYLIEYYPSDQQVAKISTQSTWLAQWSIVAGNGRVYLEPIVCRIPVRPSVV